MFNRKKERRLLERCQAFQKIRSFLDYVEENQDSAFSCVVVVSHNDGINEVINVEGANYLEVVNCFRDVIKHGMDICFAKAKKAREN